MIFYLPWYLISKMIQEQLCLVAELNCVCALTNSWPNLWLRPWPLAQFLEHKNIKHTFPAPPKGFFLDSLSRGPKVPGHKKSYISFPAIWSDINSLKAEAKGRQRGRQRRQKWWQKWQQQQQGRQQQQWWWWVQQGRRRQRQWWWGWWRWWRLRRQQQRQRQWWLWGA